MVSFTVAIPTCDRRETALLAVRSALAQTRPPDQVLVICDGCTDGTVEAIRAIADDRVHALDLPKAPGYGYAHRNESLRLATGDAIVWLGDDDLLLPDHLEQVGAVWDAGLADVVQAPAVMVHPDDRLEAMEMDWSVPSNRARLAHQSRTPMGAVAISVELARALGGWNSELPRRGDWDLWRRALDAGARPAMTAEPTLLHFRATQREQDWDARVAQNARWLERMGDPRELMALRNALRRARAEREARLGDEHDELFPAAAERDELREQLSAARVELGHARAEIEHLRRRDRTLQAILDGGWWRLRSRLLPLLRLAGRVRRATRRSVT